MNFLRRSSNNILIAFAVLLTLAVASISFVRFQLLDSIYNYNQTSVNIRELPDINSPIVGKIDPNEYLSYHSVENGWYKVSNGYVADYVIAKNTRLVSINWSYPKIAIVIFTGVALGFIIGMILILIRNQSNRTSIVGGSDIELIRGLIAKNGLFGLDSLTEIQNLKLIFENRRMFIENHTIESIIKYERVSQIFQDLNHRVFSSGMKEIGELINLFLIIYGENYPKYVKYFIDIIKDNTPMPLAQRM